MPPQVMNENAEQPGTRQLRPLVIPASDYAHRDRWAIIVGISTYEHNEWNLKYAHRDAEAFYELIRKPSGGGFEADHIVKLINEEATTRNIYKALRGFLKKPAQEDVVLIYLACHGAPDPDLPENVYLITYDTDPNDIAGTAVPMREINLSLQENLRAERRIIIADTCHSGVISERGLRSGDETAPVNRFLQSLSKTQAGLALLTSARSNETSCEDAKWGGGHGVFTHFLLEGMRGEADRNPKNGIVTVDELVEYVREKVHEATNRRQHSYTGPGPVFDWPVAWTGGRSAQGHLQLGQGLLELGWLLDDKGRFESAAQQFAEALHFARLDSVTLPEASLGCGQALLAADRYKDAITDLSKLAGQDASKDYPRVHLYLGVAYAKMGEHSKAAAALETFRQQSPKDENSAWVREYIELSKQPGYGKKLALLIGIDQHTDQRIPPLRGCVNDMHLIRQTLTNKLGFEEADIVTLTDSAATRHGILEAMDNLSNLTVGAETVLVFFSGWGLDDFGSQLIVYDTKIEGNIALDGIEPRELHRRMMQIKGAHKVLILDAKATTEFIDLVRRDADYSVLSEAEPDELVYESDGVGVLTRALTHELSQSNATTMTYDEIVHSITESIRASGQNQKPVFIGVGNQLVFSAHRAGLDFFEFSHRKIFPSFTVRKLKHWYTRFRKQVMAPFPQVYLSFGRAFLEKSNYPQALHTIQTAIEQSQKTEPEAVFALGVARCHAQQYESALATFQRHVKMVDQSALIAHMKEPMEQIAGLHRNQRYALLIGINQYIAPDISNLRGCVNDVKGLQQILVEKYGFQKANMRVLLDSDATREAILSAFQELVEQAREAPAFFYFAGYGSIDAFYHSPTIISADGRQTGIFDDIELRELVALVSDTPVNLISIVDAGWPGGPRSDSRFILPNTGVKPSTREGTPQMNQDLTGISSFSLQIGRLVIYHPASIFVDKRMRYRLRAGYDIATAVPVPGETAEQKIYSALAHALIRGLQEADLTTLTYAQLIESVSATLEPSRPSSWVVGDDLEEHVFSNSVAEAAVYDGLAKITQEPLRQTTVLLRRLIEQRNDHYPEGYLNLGIAYAYLQEYDEAIEKLEKALAQQKEYLEARYHLGRILLECRCDMGRAIEELRQVIKEDKDNVAARYYLGQALQAFVEQDILVEAEQAYRECLAGGAPLGQEEEVQAFLDSRKAEKRGGAAVT